MRLHRTCAAAAFLLCTVSVPLSAQDGDLGDRFASLAIDNAKGYVGPVAEGLGHALTAGFAQTARSHKLLGFDIGVRVMAALPSAARETFDAIVPTSVSYEGVTFTNPYASANGSLATPTAVGAGDGIVLVPQGNFRQAILLAGENPDDYTIEFPEGLDLPAVPFAIAQFSIGLPFSTEFTLRMVPAVTPDEEIGEIKATGFGVKHTVTHWLPTFPVDVAVFAGTQDFQVGDWLDANAVTYGVIASRSIGPLTAFGHVRRASADVSVGYTVDNPDDVPGLPADGTRLGFEANVPAAVRAGGGLTIRLIGLDITGEYTQGPQRVVSVKAGLSIR